jgi:hypothetical protein
MKAHSINIALPHNIRIDEIHSPSECNYLTHPIFTDLLRSTEILPALLKAFLAGTVLFSKAS